MRRPLQELVDQEGFTTAILVGLLLAGALFVLWRVLGRRHPIRLGGVAFCLGAVSTSLATDGRVDGTVAMIIGLPLLAAAGAATRARRWRFAARTLVLLPGAAVVGIGVAAESGWWMAPILVGFVLLGAAAITDPRTPPSFDSVGPILLAITLLGIYACVPETEDAAIVLGVALPLVLVAWPVRAVELGRGGSAACVGVMAWLAGAGGSARHGSVIGALACIGLLGSVPLLAALDRRFGPTRASSLSLEVPTQVVLLVVDLFVVAICSRVAGRQSSVWTSGLIAIVALAVGLALSWLLLPEPVAPEATAPV